MIAAPRVAITIGGPMQSVTGRGTSRSRLIVVGGGLAGCEAAWQAARRGLEVTLYEMKPLRFSPAHSSPAFAELVCSNSLRSNLRAHAVGLLKEEMRRLGSLVVEAADQTAVPAGQALAVDRKAFASRITELIELHPRICVRRELAIFRSLPGLSEAVFARYGSVHRNTYVNAPRWLTETLEVRGRPGLYIAGQMAGVEGYVESAALGFPAGVNAACRARGPRPGLPDEATAHGALLRYLIRAEPDGFQPMNVNYGLFPPNPGLPRRIRKREKNERLAARALERLEPFAAEVASLLE